MHTALHNEQLATLPYDDDDTRRWTVQMDGLPKYKAICTVFSTEYAQHV